MNILIMKPKDGKFSVTVSVDPILPRGEEEVVDTRKIKEYLRSKNIPFGVCEKSSVVTNTNPRTNFGEWVFLLPEDTDTSDTDDEPVRRSRPRRRKAKIESEEE